MRTIAVINQKGGVGKTTVTANLGHALALTGARVTLMDLDPQGQLVAVLGIFKPPQHGIGDVFAGERLLSEVRLETREGLQLIPAGVRLAEFAEITGDVGARSRMLQRALQGEDLARDFLLLDCPPASALLSLNALLAADEILVPVNGDYLSLNGLAHLLIHLKRVAALREQPPRRWIVLNRFNARRRLSRDVLAKLLLHFPGCVLQTAVRDISALAECPRMGRSIFEYRPQSPAAADFQGLAQDLIHANTH